MWKHAIYYNYYQFSRGMYRISWLYLGLWSCAEYMYMFSHLTSARTTTRCIQKIMKVIKWSKARKIHSGDLFYNTLRAHNKLAWMKSFFLESFHEWTNDCVCWKMTILSDTKSKTGIWVSCLQVCWRNSVYRYYIVWSWHALVHYCGTKQTFPVSHQHSHHRAMSPFICGILFSCMNALFLTTSF